MSAEDKNFLLLTEESREGDLLQHRPLARALAGAIRSTPKEESLGMALYGAWGQGKSMIGHLVEECLQDEIDEGRYVFVRVDAWKYAHEGGDRQPLRRHYLLRAYESAGLLAEAERLRRAFSQKVIGQAIDERSKTAEIFRTLRARARAHWRWIASAALVLVVLSIFNPLGVATLVLAIVGVISTLLVTLSVMVETTLRLITTGLTVTTEEDPFRSVEEFDSQFTKLLTKDAAHVERFVFFIDDLDRCDDEIVVEAIETLQAFFGRERCAYLVAADERQLKRAVRARSSGPADTASAVSAIPTDETFLEKIFQTSVHVPPLYEANLLEYAEKVSEPTTIGRVEPELRDDILGYLVHPHVVSPRQVRVILNDFLIVLFEAMEREASEETYLPERRLSADPLFLAKMVVLRSHFPWFFGLLYSRPELLVQWPTTFGVDEEDWSEEQSECDATVWAAAARSVGESHAFAKPVVSALSDQGQVGMSAADGESGEEDEEEDEGGKELAEATEDDPRVDSLVRALRGYLTLTQETAPEDPARVQEFLYLRGREGYAGLTGDAGRVLRQAIATGDVTAVGDLLGQDSTQADAAATAALDRLDQGTRLERASARRALMEIVKFLPEKNLGPMGQRIVETVYAPDLVNQMSEDDPDARRTLVRWFEDNHLEEHLASAWPSDRVGIREILDRAETIGARTVVTDAIGEHLREPEFIEAVAVAFRHGRRESANAYAVDVARLTDKFRAAVQARLGISFTLQSVDQRRVTGTDGELGESKTYPLARGLEWPAEGYVGQEVQLDLFKSRARWTVYRVALAADPSQAWETRAPALLTEDGRSGALALLSAVIDRASAVPTQAVAVLAGAPYDSDDEALHAVHLLQRAVEEQRFDHPSDSLAELLAGKSFARRTRVALSVGETALKFDRDAIREQAREIVGYFIGHAEYWEDDEMVAPLGEAFRSARVVLAEGKGEEAIDEAFDPGFGDRYRLRVLREFIAPLDPARAVRLVADLLRGLLAPDSERVDEDTEDILEALELLEALASTERLAVADVIQELDVSSDAPALCEGVLKVWAAAHVTAPLDVEVLEAGARAGPTGARAALTAVLGWKDLEERHVEIIMEGAAAHEDHVPAEELVAAIDRARKIVRPIDQIGMLADAGALSLAEAVASGMKMKGHPVRGLFSAARQVRDLQLVERRLGYVEAWSGESRDIDKLAVDGYVAELKSLDSEARMRVVIDSTLRYFESGDQVPKRPSLREAVFDAMERLRPIEDAELQARLELARTQLGIETERTHEKVERRFRRIFRR